MKGFKTLPKMKAGGSVKKMNGGGSTSDYHPLVQKGLSEGRIDKADARWLSDYANTKGSSKVETGSKAMPDQSQKMENYLNRVKSGEVSNPFKREQKTQPIPELTGRSDFSREQLKEQALKEQRGSKSIGGGMAGEIPKAGLLKKPLYKRGGKVKK